MLEINLIACCMSSSKSNLDGGMNIWLHFRAKFNVDFFSRLLHFESTGSEMKCNK